MAPDDDPTADRVRDRIRDRAAGCLWGLALGDALGMPTQLLSRQQIRARYGVLDGFQVGPADHPIAAGLPAGRVTDDTEQALLLAGLLGPGGSLDEPAWAHALLDWEQTMRARGSLDLLGPSTRRALDAFRAGVPADRTGLEGTTNGAAMRVAPVGIAVPARLRSELLNAVLRASRLTHHTAQGLAGAAAVAAAVSVAIDGLTGDVVVDSVGAGIEASAEIASDGRWLAGGTVAARAAWAVELARSLPRDHLAEALDTLVGTSLAANESVPCALAVAVAFADSPWDGLLFSASLGGDCDTIAAMAGAILGAAHGLSGWPAAAVAQVREANDLPMDVVIERLVGLRLSASSGSDG